jgi:hypothetical protein
VVNKTEIMQLHNTEMCVGHMTRVRRETKVEGSLSRTLRSRKKGASLLYMIPLERWNVERPKVHLGTVV